MIVMCSSHSHDCHVKCSISHSTSPLASFQAIRVGITLDDLVLVRRKSHHGAGISTIMSYIDSNSRYSNCRR